MTAETRRSLASSSSALPGHGARPDFGQTLASGPFQVLHPGKAIKLISGTKRSHRWTHNHLAGKLCSRARTRTKPQGVSCPVCYQCFHFFYPFFGGGDSHQHQNCIFSALRRGGPLPCALTARALHLRVPSASHPGDSGIPFLSPAPKFV